MLPRPVWYQERLEQSRGLISQNCRPAAVIAIAYILVNIYCYSRLVISVTDDLTGLGLSQVGCRELKLDSQDTSEFILESRYELWSSVRYNSIQQSVNSIDVLYIQLSSLLCCNSLLVRDRKGLLAKAVYQNLDYVVVITVLQQLVEVY